MRMIFLVVVVLHALLHLMGAAKGFGLAELPVLTRPVSPGQAVGWLAAALLLLATAAALVYTPRVWWAVGLAAVVLSQVMILTAWPDAKWGTVANLVVLLGVLYGFAAEGPWSLRADYRRMVGARLPVEGPASTVTEEDIAELPDPLRRYLRVTNTVGAPRARSFRVAWEGRIRGEAADAWMEFTAEQHNVVDEPARFFLMKARRGFLPVDVLHVFRDGTASMRVRLLSAVPLVHARGPEMTRAETVTLFNDLSIFAPSALLDPAIEWEEVDERTVRGRYTLGPDTVAAVLSFDEAGRLVDFVSDDRLAASPDGSEFTPRRWSTPVGDYRRFGDRYLTSSGEGRWHPEGEASFPYFEGRILEVEVNGPP